MLRIKRKLKGLFILALFLIIPIYYLCVQFNLSNLKNFTISLNVLVYSSQLPHPKSIVINGHQLILGKTAILNYSPKSFFEVLIFKESNKILNYLTMLALGIYIYWCIYGTKKSDYLTSSFTVKLFSTVFVYSIFVILKIYLFTVIDNQFEQVTNHVFRLDRNMDDLFSMIYVLPFGLFSLIFVTDRLSELQNKF